MGQRASKVTLPAPTPENFTALKASIPPDKRSGIAGLLRRILQSPLDSKLRLLKINNAAVGRVLPTPEAVNYVRLAGFLVQRDELRMDCVVMRRLVTAVTTLESV